MLANGLPYLPAIVLITDVRSDSIGLVNSVAAKCIHDVVSIPLGWEVQPHHRYCVLPGLIPNP